MRFAHIGSVEKLDTKVAFEDLIDTGSFKEKWRSL